MDERILNLLRRNRQGLTLQNIFKELAVPRKERAKLESRLMSLEGKKLIRRVKNRYLLPPPRPTSSAAGSRRQAGDSAS